MQSRDRGKFAIGRTDSNLGRVDVKVVIYYTEPVKDPFGQ